MDGFKSTACICEAVEPRLHDILGSQLFPDTQCRLSLVGLQKFPRPEDQKEMSSTGSSAAFSAVNVVLPYAEKSVKS